MVFVSKLAFIHFEFESIFKLIKFNYVSIKIGILIDLFKIKFLSIIIFFFKKENRFLFIFH